MILLWQKYENKVKEKWQSIILLCNGQESVSSNNQPFSVPTPEVSQRIQTAHPGGRQVMLHYLLPWMNNVELVDFKPTVRRPEDCGSGEDDEDAHEREIMMVNSRRWLRGEGWGSPRATTMVLNNLMFMTAKVRQLMDHVHTWTGMVWKCWLRYLIDHEIYFYSMGMSLLGQR